METGDLRHILISNKLPEYNSFLLVPYWEKIIKEYEKLTNTYSYSDHLRKVDSGAAKLNRLVSIIACYYLLKYNHPDGEMYAKFWNVTTNINSLATIILQERTKLNIEALRNKQQPVKVDFDFDKILVNIENNLERNLDQDKITVKKWVYLCKSIEEKSKALERLKNGRGQDNGK